MAPPSDLEPTSPWRHPPRDLEATPFPHNMEDDNVYSGSQFWLHQEPEELSTERTSRHDPNGRAVRIGSGSDGSTSTSTPQRSVIFDSPSGSLFSQFREREPIPPLPLPLPLRNPDSCDSYKDVFLGPLDHKGSLSDIPGHYLGPSIVQSNAHVNHRKFFDVEKSTLLSISSFSRAPGENQVFSGSAYFPRHVSTKPSAGVSLSKKNLETKLSQQKGQYDLCLKCSKPITPSGRWMSADSMPSRNPNTSLLHTDNASSRICGPCAAKERSASASPCSMLAAAPTPSMETTSVLGSSAGSTPQHRQAPTTVKTQSVVVLSPCATSPRGRQSKSVAESHTADDFDVVSLTEKLGNLQKPSECPDTKNSSHMLFGNTRLPIRTMAPGNERASQHHGFSTANTDGHRNHRRHSQQSNRQGAGEDSEPNNSDQDEGNGEPSGPGRSSDAASDPQQKTFACSFYANAGYVRRYPDTCQNCVSPLIKTIPALIQHLMRVHNYCAECSQFVNPSEDTSPEANCRKCKTNLGNEPRPKNLIGKRCAAKDKWQSIYENLWGKEGPAVSPYVNGPAEIRYALDRYALDNSVSQGIQSLAPRSKAAIRTTLRGLQAEDPSAKLLLEDLDRLDSMSSLLHDPSERPHQPTSYQSYEMNTPISVGTEDDMSEPLRDDPSTTSVQQPAVSHYAPIQMGSSSTTHQQYQYDSTTGGQPPFTMMMPSQIPSYPGPGSGYASYTGYPGRQQQQQAQQQIQQIHYQRQQLAQQQLTQQRQYQQLLARQVTALNHGYHGSAPNSGTRNWTIPANSFASSSPFLSTNNTFIQPAQDPNYLYQRQWPQQTHPSPRSDAYTPQTPRSSFDPSMAPTPFTSDNETSSMSIDDQSHMTDPSWYQMHATD